MNIYINLLPHSYHTLFHQSPSTSQSVVSRRYGEPGFKKSDLNHPPHISFTHTTHVLKGCYKIPRSNRNWLRKMTKFSSKLPKEFFEPSSYDFHNIFTRFSQDFHNIFTTFSQDFHSTGSPLIEPPHIFIGMQFNNTVGGAFFYPAMWVWGRSL